jgi:hypothetical protein
VLPSSLQHQQLLHLVVEGGGGLQAVRGRGALKTLAAMAQGND